MSELKRYDIIVIGAGINGAAIAREAALHGYRVLLVEQADIGGGTSAASTRLIHGGLRYLEHAELKLVRESLHERERLLRLAPHLVTPLRIVLPLYRGGARRPWQIRAGMRLYDWLARSQSLPRHRMLSREDVLAELPGLAPDELVGGAAYYDAQVRFPERLVVENVCDAVAHGAELLTYARVTRILVAAGRVRGVEWRRRGGAAETCAADIVVNASGPWVDRVLGAAADGRLIGGTKGSHLVCRPFPGAPPHAVYAEAAGDGRPFFVVPWNELYLIGTTDERCAEDPGEVRISLDEYRYLVAAVERLFPAARPLDDFVCYTQAGVRPLPRSTGARTAAITRRHLIHEHRHAVGLVSIVGGKLTTHRALAEDALRRLKGRGAGAPACPTRDRALPGALPAAERDALLAALGAQFSAAQAARLWRTYGAGARTIAALARGAAELAEPVSAGSPTLVAELVHALTDEWATTLADVLQRRCMAGLDADRGIATAPAAAQWLVRLGIWDRARADEEVADYRAAVRRLEPPHLASAPVRDDPV